jgi:hypothetical protein
MMGADVKPEVEKITVKLVEQGNETTFQVKPTTLVRKVSDEAGQDANVRYNRNVLRFSKHMQIDTVKI